MATQGELEDIEIQEAVTLLPVHDTPTDLIGKAVIVYDKTTGAPMAFDADVMSGRGKVVVGTQQQIDDMTKVAGVFYCTYED